jgi:hypothetical protein
MAGYYYARKAKSSASCYRKLAETEIPLDENTVSRAQSRSTDDVVDVTEKSIDGKHGSCNIPYLFIIVE